MDKVFNSWAQSERQVLSLMMAREECGWCLTILYWMCCCQQYEGYIIVLVSFFACVPITSFAYYCLSNIKQQKHRYAIVLAYFEVVQIFNYRWALLLPNESFSFFQASTVILILHQLSPMLPWFLNLFLVTQHFGVWYVTCLGERILDQTSCITYINLCWSLFHIYTHLAIKKHVLGLKGSQLHLLQRKEEHISALYEALPNGLLVVTEERKVATYNKVILEFLGLENEGMTEELVSSMLAQLKYVPDYTSSQSESEMSLVDAIMDYISSDQTQLRELGVVLVNEKYLEWRAKKLKWDEGKACLVCIRDISRWVELERIAKRESDSKSALLRSVSHELKTPTNAIFNLVEDIKEKERLSPESLQDVAILSSSAYFLMSMINDLLDFSSMKNGSFRLKKQFFSLENTIKECVKLIEVQCKHKKLELVVRYDSHIPTQVYNDKGRLKQVILNLLSNALKFTITGKVEVVAVSVSETHAGIRVIDTGVGISEESIKKIFELFGKLEGNEGANPQGCGLGLSISSMLVKSMGGSGFHVSSQRHHGSLFAFELCIVRDEELAPPPDFLLQSDSPDLLEGVSKIVIPVAISTKKQVVHPDILIADDVEFNRIVLRKILESVGYDCDEAPTGVQVIQLVKHRANMGKPYLVILMDVEMPEMDGIAATRELAAMTDRGELATFPLVIGCSAYSSAEDKDNCLRAGMQQYLEKPVIREVLFQLLLDLAPTLSIRGALR